MEIIFANICRRGFNEIKTNVSKIQVNLVETVNETEAAVNNIENCNEIFNSDYNSSEET